MTLKKIAQFSIGPIGTGILGVITLPIVTWYFSSEDIGKLSIAQVTLSFMVMIVSLGMHQAYVREYHEEEDKLSLFKMVMLPSMMFFIFLLFIGYWTPWSISSLLFGIESSFNSFLIVLATFALIVTNFLVHMLRMQERGLAYSFSQLLPKVLFLIFIGLVVSTHILEVSFNTLLLLHVITIVVTTLLFSFITKQTWIASIKSKYDNEKVKEMLKFSLPLVAGSLAFWGVTAMDRFFLRGLSSFEELGLYSVAISFAGAATILSTLFSNIWQPVLYKWVKEGVDPKNIQKVMEYVLLVVVTIWCLAGIFSWLILYILPSEYEAVSYLLVLTMVYPMMYLLSESTKVGIGIAKKSSFAMITSMVAFVVNALFNYLLIPEYGAKGAAIASAIAFFVFLTLRTEFSAYLWVSLSRKKIYFFVIVLLGATFFMTVTEAKSSFNGWIWITIWFVTGLVYRQRVIESYHYIKVKLKGNK